MKKLSILISFLTLLLVKPMGQNKNFFPNLSFIKVDKNYDVNFGYNPATTKIVNKPCYMLDKSNPFYCEKDTFNNDDIFVGTFRNKALNYDIGILFSTGFSADPCFYFYKNDGTLFWSINCLNLLINEQGTIYSSGHTNSMFNIRRKFQMQPDTIIEISQPYHYVGLKGRTLKPISLYQDKTSELIVAQLPKNYEIEILLADTQEYGQELRYDFLVKTKFGLVGWLRLTGEDIFGTVLKGLYFAGD